MKKLPIWLGDGKWDVIHFNFGIHDRATPLADYERNLESLVTLLKATGAKLIWASTTPVPRNVAENQTPEAIEERNVIALNVMNRNGVAIDDLNVWIKPDLAKLQNPNDVHFGLPGYDRLAERVAHVIETALPGASANNSAIKPSGKLEMDSYSWEDRHAAVMAAKEKINPEIVLIGDSITHFWGGEPDGGTVGNRGAQAWHGLFGQRAVLNLGFGWDRTQNVLKRIEMGELDGIKPKTIIIHIGTNNLAGTPQARANTPAEIAEAISLIVDRAQAKCPAARIILMAIFPRGEKPSDPARAILADINQRLVPLAQKPQVTLLDTTTTWLQPDGSISKETMPDFLHPNEKGYSIWADALRPVLPK
ncbi:MAG: SGNH/GDSL hydrolase family protein [Luteolibacter sp.]|nr:SGNH/GDSL hydrolase family protein [Luteolibacter sp.]